MCPGRPSCIGLCDIPGARQNVRRITCAIAKASLLASLMASLVTSAALCREGRCGPDRHRYPLRGIDVSHYQGVIDWPAVARNDVAFAYVKATEGVDDHDAQFARNWKGARRARIRVGAYHYFIFCRSGRAQARNFLAVAPHQRSALAPAVDLEEGHSCPGRLTGREMRRELDEFLALVEAREKKHAVLYVTPQFFATYRAYLPKRPLWRRSIMTKPAPNGSWTYWQYHCRGRVAGIRTLVDLNVSNAGRRASAL
jgi:lysozyme